MSGIIQTNNGLAYDFGVAIAQGASSALAVMATKVLAITGAVYALMDAGKTADAMLNKNQVALGGYANYLKAVDYFSQKVASGQSYFNTEDLINGSKTLQRAGIDVKRNFDFINKAAQGIGTSFSEMSNIIRTGDYSALAEAGLITDRMATSMQRFTFTQQQGTKKVLALLKQADAKGMFEGSVRTMEQEIMRIREIYNSIMRAVIGDLKDPESFWYNLKKMVGDFADFFYQRMEKIKKIATAVGKVLIFAIRVVSDFAKFTYRIIRSVIGNTDSFFNNWQEKMLSFGLWLEILRIKIKDFFIEYEGYIRFILKALIAYRAFKFGSNLWFGALYGARKYFDFMSFRIKRLKVEFLLLTRNFNSAYNSAYRLGEVWKNTSILSVIRNIAVASWSWTASMLANPIGLIVIAVVAILAALYYIWKYWDDIRGYTNETSDWVIMVVNALVPAVGLVMSIAKYWNEIKTFAINFWNYLTNIADILVSVGKIIKDKVIYYWDKLVAGVQKAFKIFDSVMTAVFGNVWVKFKEKVWQPIKDALKKVKEWFIDAFDFKIGDAWNKVIGWIKKGVNDSKQVADVLAAKAGRQSFSKGSVDLEDVQRVEIKKLIEQGKSDAEIIKVMDNGNFDRELIQKVREEKVALTPKNTIPLQPAKTPQANNTNVNQKNSYNIYVSKEADAEKVAQQVIKSTQDAMNTDNRKSGI